MWPNAVPPLRSFARTGFPRMFPSPRLPRGSPNERVESTDAPCVRAGPPCAMPLARCGYVCDNPANIGRMEMSVVLGTGEHRYRVVEGWGKVPDGWNLTDVGAVAVD